MKRLRLESSIEDAVCRRARDELGVPSTKLAVAFGMGETGLSDRLYWVPGGAPLLVEFKRPGEEPRPKQSWWHRRLRGYGYDVQVHDDPEEAFSAIRRATAAGLVRLAALDPGYSFSGKRAPKGLARDLLRRAAELRTVGTGPVPDRRSARPRRERRPGAAG